MAKLLQELAQLGAELVIAVGDHDHLTGSLDIGYTGGIPAFPRRIVAPALGTTDAALPQYPELAADAMMVRKLNPAGS